MLHSDVERTQEEVKKHYSQYLREEIEHRGRRIEILSLAAREAEKSASAMRDKFKPEQTRRMEAEQALHESNLEIARLKLENQQLRDQFIDQSKLQDALSEANAKIKKQEKELNRRSGLENPYGLATPSSKKVNKPNSTPENQAKRGGAEKGHKGHGRKDFSPEEADKIIHLNNIPAPCECGGIWLSGGKEKHCVYHYIPVKLEKRIYYKNVCVCSLCGERIVGKTPGVMPDSLFSNSMAAFLLTEHYFHGSTIGSLEQRYGINHGTFIGIAHRVATLLENAFEKIIEALRFCEVVHADETSWMMDGKKAYAWIFANDIFRAFLFRDTRGSVVPLEVFGDKLLELILVTDRYCGYSPLELLHQFCYVHLMRDVKKLKVEFPEDEEIVKFVNDLNPLLAKAIGLRNEDLSLKEHQEKAIELKNQIMEICKSSAKHPGIQHIQNIFREKTDCLFQWVNSPDIPAENNYAERGLRPTVIARKISFGSHSEKGMRTREIMMTVMHTAKCRGHDPAEFMEEILDILARDKSADISHMLIPEKTAKGKFAA